MWEHASIASGEEKEGLYCDNRNREVTTNSGHVILLHAIHAFKVIHYVTFYLKSPHSLLAYASLSPLYLPQLLCVG